MTSIKDPMDIDWEKKAQADAALALRRFALRAQEELDKKHPDNAPHYVSDFSIRFPQHYHPSSQPFYWLRVVVGGCFLLYVFALLLHLLLSAV